MEYSEETQKRADVPQNPRKQQNPLFNRLVFLLVVLIITVIVLQGTVFRLKYVSVLGNHTKTDTQVIQASGLVEGMNIFTISEDAVREAVESDHTLSFVRMQKAYPDTIYLYVSERVAAATLQYLGFQYTLDAQGIVLSESDQYDIPEGALVITGLQVTSARVGNVVSVKDSTRLAAYQAIMAELEQQLFRDQVSEVNLSTTDSLYLVTVDGLTVRLGSQDHMRAKIGALRTDLGYLRQTGMRGGTLDVSIPEDAKYTPNR